MCLSDISNVNGNPMDGWYVCNSQVPHLVKAGFPGSSIIISTNSVAVKPLYTNDTDLNHPELIGNQQGFQ